MLITFRAAEEVVFFATPRFRVNLEGVVWAEDPLVAVIIIFPAILAVNVHASPRYD